MNVLVTGAFGFVGRNLVENLKNIRDGKNRTRPALRIDEIYEYGRESTQEELDSYCSNADFVFNLAGVNACEKVTERFAHMPRCLVNHDLFPINILIKERTFTAGAQRVIHPQAYIVDWTNGRPGPYILDLARVISHCHRETILDAGEMLYSPKYCSDSCRKAIVETYAHGVESRISRTELDKDLLCGEFFEIARMFVQMPTVQPRDSYDRYYFFNMMSLADRVLTEFA